MTNLTAYQFILEVNPVGGEEKASAVLDIRRRTGIGLEDTTYIGDSITDVQAFQLVREGGGLAVSFNGNEYALREAEFAVISDNTVVTSVLAEAFHRAGLEGVNCLVDEWTLDNIKTSWLVNEYLAREFEKVFPNNLPTVARVTPQNMKMLTRQSLAFRRSVRGEIIGALG
jgi:energy-converting hydrogenase A subunit R